MLAAVFVASGVDVLRNPGPRVAKAQDVAPQIAEKLGLPKDTEMLVKVNAATHVVAGSLLAIGKFRRLSALALMASMVPTTYAGHRFWEMDDPQERAQNQTHFLKNLAVMGGLMLEVLDTEGRPSVGWLSRKAARSAASAAAASAPVAKGAAAMKAAGAVSDAATSRVGKGAAAAKAVGKAKGTSELSGRAARMAKKAAKADVVITGASRARDLAETAAKAKVTKDLASKVVDVSRSADLPAKAAAATAAANRMAS